MMKYLMFAGHSYYPKGGIDDLVGLADNIDDLKRMLERDTYKIADGDNIELWAHIVETATMKIVEKGTVKSVQGDFGIAELPIWENKP